MRADPAWLRAAQEGGLQRANEGQSLPRSFGVPRARARRPQSLSQATLEPAFLARRGRLEARKRGPEPPVLELRESSGRRNQPTIVRHRFLPADLEPCTIEP